MPVSFSIMVTNLPFRGIVDEMLLRYVDLLYNIDE